MLTTSASTDNGRPEIAIALVASNTTAIAAELAAEAGGYREVIAVVRRGAITTLPVMPDSDFWVDKVKHLKLIGARKEIRALKNHITQLTGGRYYDCFVHHSTNAFSQILANHPLCRKFFYIEEGITAIIGGKFGRPKKRLLRSWLWKIRNPIFYGGQIDHYRPFFDVEDPKYGGAYALSRNSFKGIPRRIQLPFESLAATTPVPADIMIFLDSQYLQGNCSTPNYINAITGCLSSIITSPSSAAIKFHPGEKNSERKLQIIQAIESVKAVTNVIELPSDYIAERMIFDPNVKVVVGTSALGFYIGERGFQTFTFSKRLADSSPKYAKVLKQLPKEFLEVCQSA